MPLLQFQSRGEMWALSRRSWASAGGMEPWALLPFCKAPGKQDKRNRAALKVPAKLFLRAAGLGGKWGFWENDPAFNTHLEPTKQKHNHLHLMIKKKTWRTVALLDLFNWIIKLRWNFFLQQSGQSFMMGQNNSEQSFRSTQNLSSLEKWGLISTS